MIHSTSQQFRPAVIVAWFRSFGTDGWTDNLCENSNHFWPGLWSASWINNVQVELRGKAPSFDLYDASSKVRGGFAGFVSSFFCFSFCMLKIQSSSEANEGWKSWQTRNNWLFSSMRRLGMLLALFNVPTDFSDDFSLSFTCSWASFTSVSLLGFVVWNWNILMLIERIYIISAYSTWVVLVLADSLCFSASCLRMEILSPAENLSKFSLPSWLTTFRRFSMIFFGRASLDVSWSRQRRAISAKINAV